MHHGLLAMNGYDEPRLARARQRFLDILSNETGIPFKHGAIPSQAHFIIQTAGPSAAVQQLGEDESYEPRDFNHRLGNYLKIAEIMVALASASLVFIPQLHSVKHPFVIA